MERKCVALVSGGLDSLLAARILAAQGVFVEAVTFATAFGCGTEGGGSCGHAPREEDADERFPNIHYKVCHLGQEYVDMVLAPRFGYGRNMNPCVDCRVMMLNWGKEYMKAKGASFLVTGEVLGQRPKSQRRHTLAAIDREVGMEGYILRPLSAKLLAPTVPEREGVVDRERLYAIRGRTRAAQFALAREFGLRSYPSPAGGCLLTDPGFSRRFRDLIQVRGRPNGEDIELIKFGRIFRLAGGTRLHVGRDHGENQALEALRTPTDAAWRLCDYRGPLGLTRGPVAPEEEPLVAAILARYGQAPSEPGVRVAVERPGELPAVVLSGEVPDEAALQAMRVGEAGVPAAGGQTVPLGAGDSALAE
ncbi:MAG: hypothetical protein HY722_00705 [Planctomycetes bacterium]|nr:hypothetical protein [Planctomycetota bacterium]